VGGGAGGLLVAALFLSGVVVARAFAAFTEIPEFGTGHTLSVAWGDYDNDGDLDLAVGNNGDANELFVNDGAGSFMRETPFGTWLTFAVAWGDYDNDGDLDLAVGNGGGQQNKLYVNDGGGTFHEEDRFGTSSTVAVAWADYDLDGDLDLAVGNGILGLPERNFLYINNGDGTFTESFQFGRKQTDSVVWGDFDGDGDPDLAIGNGGFGAPDQNALFVNNGDGTFARVDTFGTGDTAALAWGDFDGDGDLDLAVGNWETGENLLYVNEGGVFAGQAAFGDRDTNTLSWGDFDNDGDLDLAVGNGDFLSADSNFLYVSNGDGTFTEEFAFGLGSTDAVAWGDYDNDGDLDLAVGNEHSPSQNYLYRNEENDAASIRIHLVGRRHDLGTGYSNRDGIGAKVAMYAAGHLGDPAHRLGFREIEAHGGFSPESAIDAHFGVGDAASVDLRIVWPGSDGERIVQDLPGVVAGERLVVVESGVFTGVGGAESPIGAKIRFDVMPNPVKGSARFLIEAPGGGPGVVDLFDVGGRHVRTIPLDRAGGPEVWSAVWDRRGASGAEVPSGVYFARFTGASPSSSRRIVVVR
jgi:hypothetical protein